MAADWMTRAIRVFRPPKCAACGVHTQGGILCDVCAQDMLDRTRDSTLRASGPHPID